MESLYQNINNSVYINKIYIIFNNINDILLIYNNITFLINIYRKIINYFY